MDENTSWLSIFEVQLENFTRSPNICRFTRICACHERVVLYAGGDQSAVPVNPEFEKTQPRGSVSQDSYRWIAFQAG